MNPSPKVTKKNASDTSRLDRIASEWSPMENEVAASVEVPHKQCNPPFVSTHMKKILQLLALSAMTTAAPHSTAALEVGSELSNFAANDDTGEIWSAAEYIGKKNIVVYFYPAAMTGGCTAQACSYRDYSTNLDEADAIVVGISGDSVKGLSLFKEAHNLNFPLLSDPNGSIAEIFGVPTRAGGSIEREINGDMHTFFRNLTTSRWTFIIGKDGKVIYKNEEVNAREDTSTVLAVLKEHQ